MIFLATLTAAGTATPSAAPAAIFFGVDSPSSSASDVRSSSLATIASVVEELGNTFGSPQPIVENVCPLNDAPNIEG
jgi:hypothetical protein